MKARVLITFVWVFCVVLGFGQSKFLDEIHDQVKIKKSESATASSEQFRSFWESGQLSDDHKKRFIELVVEMKKKRFQPVPQYIDNMDIIRLAVTKKNVGGTDLDTLFISLKKIVQNIPKGGSLRLTYKTIINYLSTDTIYSGNKHTYVVSGGSFRIKYAEAAPAPVSDIDIYDQQLEQQEEEEEAAQENDVDPEEAWGAWDEGAAEDEWGTVDEEEPQSHDDATTAEVEVDESILSIGYEAPFLPPLEGPIIEFKGVDLKILSKSDSGVALTNTDMSLMVHKGIVVGDKGQFNWASTGLGEDVYGDFKTYSFNIRKSVIDAEGVTLNYPSKIEEPVEGIFKYAVENVKNIDKKKFPRFMSYKSDVVIKDLGENIKYHGGFSLNGKSVHSSSVSGGKCHIQVSLDGKVKFKANAKDFSMGDSLIVGYPVSIRVYEHEDSIFHPGVRLNFNQNNQELKLYKSKSVFKSSPFVDSFHKLEIMADAMYWTLDDSIIAFTNISAKNEVPAYFESFDNFQLKKYAQLQGLYPFHPLQMVTNYALKKKKDTFYAEEVAKAYRQSLPKVKSSLVGLMRAGYIDFEPRSGLIIVKDKAKHYLLARRNKVDYDYYTIRSIDPGGYNAVLNLDSSHLVIQGVDEFVISDSLNISIFPKDRKITIKKNRDFIVNGMITTQHYRFIGKNFNYSHERYDINLVEIDSIEFFVEITDSVTGEVERKVLDNKLTYSSGTLTLDEPGNKASINSNPKFPHFDANKGASIFFSGKEVLNGAYDSSIYYKIPPFDVDSLSGDMSSVAFDGTFISGGIFPDFEQKMEVQEDLAFGFERDAPEEGYPIYGGKGRFFGSISMDSRGLRGNGRIEMMGTTMESSDFVFYPDSVKAIGEQAFTKKGEYNGQSMPSMVVNDYELNWVVSKDSLTLSSYSSPIQLYDSVASLNGKVTISTERGMIGSGILETKGALTISEQIEMKSENYIGRQAQFEILSDVDGKPAVRSDMVRVDMNFNEGKARFNPETKGFASNEFPYMKYKTSIDDGVWDMNARTVTMSMPEGADISQSYFYSTHKRHDSLVFNASKAIYYMDSLKMHISGVPEVKVVDAKIIPHNGQLVIGENAEIDTLRNAVILIDTTHEYHKLFDGNIKIESKNNFSGNALYEYVNFQKDTLPIEFSKFDLVERKISKKITELHTEAKGVIAAEDTFFLAPKIQYQGEATMEADKKNLDLEGYVKLDLEGENVESTEWLKYARHDTLDEVRIDLENQEKKTEDNMFTGILFAKGKKDLYTVFVGRKKSHNDFVVFHAENMLTYDFGTEEFEVSTEKRLHKEEYEGNFLAYHEGRKDFRYSGEFHLLDKADAETENIQMMFAGYGYNHLEDSTYEIEGIGGVTYNVPGIDKLGKYIAESTRLLSLPKGLKANDSLYVSVANLAGNKTAVSYKKSLEKGYSPLYKEVKGMEGAIGFHDLILKWNHEKRAWHSVGQIGVSNIGKNDITAKLNGYVEIKNGMSGPTVNVYLELTQTIWCYFSFSQNSLITASSLNEYNADVEAKSEVDKNEPRGLYYFALASDFEKQKFLKKFATEYLGGKALVTAQSNVSLDDLDNDVLDDANTDLLNDVLDDDLGDADGLIDESDEEAFGEDMEEEELSDKKKKKKKKKKGGNEVVEEQLEDDDEELLDDLIDDESDDEPFLQDEVQDIEEVADIPAPAEEKKSKKDKKKKKEKELEMAEETTPEPDFLNDVVEESVPDEQPEVQEEEPSLQDEVQPVEEVEEEIAMPIEEKKSKKEKKKKKEKEDVVEDEPEIVEETTPDKQPEVQEEESSLQDEVQPVEEVEEEVAMPIEEKKSKKEKKKKKEKEDVVEDEPQELEDIEVLDEDEEAFGEDVQEEPSSEKKKKKKKKKGDNEEVVNDEEVIEDGGVENP